MLGTLNILCYLVYYLHSSKDSLEDIDDVSEGPQSKRMKHDEEDLGFLIVKGKDGQKQLFVDLGNVICSFLSH